MAYARVEQRLDQFQTFFGIQHPRLVLQAVARPDVVDDDAIVRHGSGSHAIAPSVRSFSIFTLS